MNKGMNEANYNFKNIKNKEKEPFLFATFAHKNLIQIVFKVIFASGL